MRPRQYLDVYRTSLFEVPEAILGPGKTLRCRLSEARGGNPETVPLVATVAELTAAAVGGTYTITLTPAALAPLLTAHIGRTIYAHLSDGAGFRDTWPLVPADTDPDLLPALVG
jgi:hypothetical protein